MFQIPQVKRNEVNSKIPCRGVPYLVCACIIAFYSSGQTQPLPSPKRIASYQLSAHTGFIFAHSSDVLNTSGARPKGVELSFTWQKNDEATWNLCNCFPQHGFILAYYDFDNQVLGKGLKAAYTLEPWYKINNSNYASLKTAAGLAYLSNPYHYEKNPTNQSYSTTVSAYLLLGVGWWHRLTDQFWIAPHVQYQHVSNGGVKLPNKGINWPTGSVTVSYRPAAVPLQSFSRSTWERKSTIRWDLGFFGSSSREGTNPNGKIDRFLIVGVMSQVVKQVGRINNISGGLEFTFNEKLTPNMQRDNIASEPIQVGFLAGHEFILGRFLFSQRIGVYLYQAGNYFDMIYHRWGLQYRFNTRWSAGFNLKAHRHVADYTDLRIVYSLQRSE